VLYRVSDRAKALIQLAEQGLECLSMPDFFHVVHELIKSYSLALGRPLRHAHQERKSATEALAHLQGLPHTAQDALEATALVAARQAEMIRWQEAHHAYRCPLETLSLTRHPFRMADSAPQTAAQVESHLQAVGEAIDVFAQDHQLPRRHAAMTKVRKQGRVSKVEMATPIDLISKVLFPSLSTFETPPALWYPTRPPSINPTTLLHPVSRVDAFF
jgi:hypothetical protein